MQGVESSSRQNLENLSKNILEYGAGIQAETAFLSFQAARSRLFPYQKTQLYLFSKSGFTKGCTELSAAWGNVTLVGCRDIWKGIANKEGISQ